MNKLSKDLTAKGRHQIADKNFVFPKEERYPIHDAAHARNALARASGKPEEAKVRAAVSAKFPGIDMEKKAMLEGFSDEMEKIAGFMQNLGTRIMWSPTGRTMQAIVKNPIEATKRGIMSSFRDPKTGKVGFMRPGQRFSQGLLLGGTALGAATALKKDDPDQVGPGKGERIGRFMGGTAAGFAAAPFGGLAPGLVAGIGGEMVGGKVGKLVDRVRGYKAKKGPEAEAILQQRAAAKQAPTPTPAVAPAQPTPQV